MIVGALISVVGREYKRVIRRPARLASTFARPLIWLIIIGSGFSAVIPGGQFSYRQVPTAGNHRDGHPLLVTARRARQRA